MDVQLRIYDSADESGQLLVVFDRNDEEEQEADLVVNEIETIEVVTHILPDPVTQADVQVWDRTAFLANTHAYDIYIYRWSTTAKMPAISVSHLVANVSFAPLYVCVNPLLIQPSYYFFAAEFPLTRPALAAAVRPYKHCHRPIL